MKCCILSVALAIAVLYLRLSVYPMYFADFMLLGHFVPEEEYQEGSYEIVDTLRPNVPRRHIVVEFADNPFGLSNMDTIFFGLDQFRFKVAYSPTIELKVPRSLDSFAQIHVEISTRRRRYRYNNFKGESVRVQNPLRLRFKLGHGAATLEQLFVQ